MDKPARPAELSRLDTRCVHAGTLPAIENRGSAPPLFQASSYEFDDLDTVEEIYAGTRMGAIYGRYGGPNALQFESALAELEGSQTAVGAASGMAAISAVLRTALAPGDAIVCASGLYGGTHALLENDFHVAGNRRISVDITDLDAVEAALSAARAPLLYVEALSNPLLTVADLPALAQIAHRRGARLVVDATFVSPALCRPLSWGADVVVHSVGKYLGGHGDVGAGVVAGSHEACAPVRGWLVRNGATLPHFEAWLALRGLRTLGLRMERHCANASAIAAYLAAEPLVARVYHPSLSEHRQHGLAQRLYPLGTGGIVSFELYGGRPEVAIFVGALELIAIVHSLGEVATTISYSAASSHRALSAAERAQAGVSDAMLRVSCGIESAHDIVADLARAFAALPARRPL